MKSASLKGGKSSMMENQVIRHVFNHEGKEILGKKLIHFQEHLEKFLVHCDPSLSKRKPGSQRVVHALVDVVHRFLCLGLFARWRHELTPLERSEFLPALEGGQSSGPSSSINQLPSSVAHIWAQSPIYVMELLDLFAAHYRLEFSTFGEDALHLLLESGGVVSLPAHRRRSEEIGDVLFAMFHALKVLKEITIALGYGSEPVADHWDSPSYHKLIERCRNLIYTRLEAYYPHLSRSN
jgi:hypothetical protein